MKVKLIKAGGLLGRTQSAEAELVYRSFPLQQSFEEFFQSLPPGSEEDQARDAFRYVVEFNGQRAVYHEQPIDNTEVAAFMESLKQELKY